jgi:hypothetical protein
LHFDDARLYAFKRHRIGSGNHASYSEEWLTAYDLPIEKALSLLMFHHLDKGWPDIGIVHRLVATERVAKSPDLAVQR